MYFYAHRNVLQAQRGYRFLSRAFLLLPMCNNIGESITNLSTSSTEGRSGIIIGPMLGGLLASPVKNYPGIFGDNSLFGGAHGVHWMKQWPYALPNLVNASILFVAAMGMFFGLEEVALHYH